MESAFRWSFSTEAPAIVSVHPGPTSRFSRRRLKDLTLDPEIQVRFNQTMDRAVVERAFFFRAGAGSDGIDVAGDFDWAEDGKTFSFTPDARLWYDSEYHAGFPPGLPFNPGGYAWSYRTAPRPAIKRTSPANGDAEVRGGGFSLYFASRMNIDTLQERIQIEPKPDELTRVYYSYMGERYDLHFKAQPSTKYTVRIDPGMEDIYGHAIADPLTFSFTTGKLPPRMSLRVPGSVGFYNANRQPARLYLSHRGVNVVNLEFSRLPLNEYITRVYGSSRRAETDDGSSQLAPLHRWTIRSSAEENVTSYDLLRLGEQDPAAPDAGEPLPPGIYYLKATAPELHERQREDGHVLNLSNAVLMMKHTADRLTVWAANVESGAPIVGERISVYNQLGEYQGGALTDENGIAHVQVWYTPEIWSLGLLAVLDTDEHFGIANSIWSQGMALGGNYIRASYDWDTIQTYLYTDRPVYRRGQPVYFRGIARGKDDIVYMPAPYETVEARLRSRETGKVVERQILDVNEFGTFHGAFDIAPKASLGRYYISVAFPNSRGEYRHEVDHVMFQVAEYRLPEYQVTLSADEPEILQGDSARFELKGRYYFGGPVSHAAAEYAAYPVPYRFDYAGGGYYRFSQGPATQYVYGRRAEERIVAEGSLQTDADGVATFDIKGDLGQEAGSQRWRVEASIRDEAGQNISTNSDLVVHQGLFYIGARPEKYVTRIGDDSIINLIAVDWESQPIAEQDIAVQVTERRWTRTQEQDLATGRVKSTWHIEEIPVTSGSATTGANGKARFIFQPSKGGRYLFTFSTRDQLGNAIRATAHSWVSSASYIPWGRSSDKTIDLVPAREDYRVGDMAQVLIASPFQSPTQALISIERGDVFSTDVVTLASNSHIHEFEILPEHAPNIFVSVFLLNPADEHNSFADWRMGSAELQVDPERYALNIEISAEPERAQPQDEVTFRLRVTDWRGDPAVAEVGVALTDLAALSLGERNSATLMETFFPPQALGVNTSSSLVYNGDEHRANLVQALGTLDAIDDMFDCCFGGGGGAYDGPLALPVPRSDFVDTPYWNPTLVTDAAGEASLTLRLPDNLTTWRLDARALTKGNDGRLLVGETTYDLISALPLLIRPLTPRFFIAGDRAQLAAIVNNNTGAQVNASVSLLNTAGLELEDPSGLAQGVTIPAGGRARVTWTVTIADVDTVAPQFAVRSVDGEFSDASISPVSQDEDGNLPVYRYEAPETVGTAGALMRGGSRVEAVLLPRDSDLRAGSLDIRIDKSLAGVTTEALTYLEKATRRHPECATAIVSRFLPNIVTYRALSELGLAQPALKAKLDEGVSQAVRELITRQRDDGGWSWCAYPKSHTLTTAHALFALAQAKQQGYRVADVIIQRAQRYLSRQLIKPSLAHKPWKLNRQAIVLYALTSSGAGYSDQAAELFEQRHRLNLDAIAYLAQTLYLINPQDSRRLDALAQMMLNRAVTRASGTFFEENYRDRWNWSSDIRSTALVLDALLKLRPQSELLPNIVRYLVTARQGRRHWSSRQENTWAIIALTNWMKASGELDPAYAWSVSLNERPRLAGNASAQNALESDILRIDVADMIQRETNLIEFARDAGAGAFYYTAHLNHQFAD